MRFRAVITNQLAMKDFYNIALSFSKLSKRGVFHCKKNGVMISNVGATVGAHPLLWATIEKGDFFEQFECEGVNAENDEIVMTFHADQFANALNMLKYFVRSIKFKLTNKQFACITIDTEVVTTASNTSRRLVHDVPVSLIPVKEWMDYIVPTPPKYDISIQMPTLKSTRILCDKMKNLSPILTVCAASNGDLSFIVETDSAMIVSRYYNLQLEQDSRIQASDKNGDEPIEVSCNVDSKQLAMCFSCIQFMQIRMTGNMVQDDIFNMKLKIRDNVFMYCSIGTVDS